MQNRCQNNSIDLKTFLDVILFPFFITHTLTKSCTLNWPRHYLKSRTAVPISIDHTSMKFSSIFQFIGPCFPLSTRQQWPNTQSDHKVRNPFNNLERRCESLCCHWNAPRGHRLTVWTMIWQLTIWIFPHIGPVKQVALSFLTCLHMICIGLLMSHVPKKLCRAFFGLLSSQIKPYYTQAQSTRAQYNR